MRLGGACIAQGAWPMDVEAPDIMGDSMSRADMRECTGGAVLVDAEADSSGMNNSLILVSHDSTTAELSCASHGQTARRAIRPCCARG